MYNKVTDSEVFYSIELVCNIEGLHVCIHKQLT